MDKIIPILGDMITSRAGQKMTIGSIGDIPYDEYERLVSFVKDSLKGYDGSHDFSHAERVFKLAMQICDKEEKANRVIVTYASLLHDVDDKKYNPQGSNKAEVYLKSCCFIDPETRMAILTTINNCSFTSCLNGGQVSLETAIVSDADKIDAIGALGVARTFMYAGAKGGMIHNPNVIPRNYGTLTSEEYKASPSATVVAHFHEKLLHLHEKMTTETGKEIAIERTKFMKSFLDQLMLELE